MGSKRCRSKVRLHSEFDGEPIPIESLREAEQLFAGMTIRMLLRHSPEHEAAELRLHRRDGRELTPWEGGSAEGERERDDKHEKRSGEGPSA